MVASPRAKLSAQLSPRFVPLPDGDTDSMATACRILNNRSTRFPIATSLTNLASTAVDVQKYDRVEAIWDGAFSVLQTS